jgi:hypothetical protein
VTGLDAGRSGRRPALLVLLLLIFSTAAVYAPVADLDFVDFDDYNRILNKPLIRAGLSWEGVRWAFGGGHHYPPLAYVGHMADVEFFGISAPAHHLSNLLLHLLNVGLLFWALLRLTGDRAPSLFVAAVFALHPLNVESVAWVSEKKNVLSTLFWLLAIGAYASYARLGGAKRYAWVVVCLALGLASKSMLVTLPFVFLLLDFWPLGRLRARRDLKPLIVEKLPMLAICAAVSLATIAMQANAGSVRSWERLALLPRLTNALASYGVYLRRLLWPNDLANLYPHTELIGLPLWSPLEAVGALVLLSAISLFVWKLGRTHPYFATGWLWFLGVLVPVIGIVQVGIQSMADRYMYVAMIGPLMMLGWGGRWLSTRYPRARSGLAVAALLAVCAAGTVTSMQIAYWKNTLTLFERALSKTDDNWLAMNNVAWKLATCPDPEVRDGKRAVALAERAVQLTSRKSANFIDTLAGAYAEAGRFDQAIAASTEAIDLAAKGGDEASVRVFRQRLQNYERDEPTRESLGCPRTSD